MNLLEKIAKSACFYAKFNSDCQKKVSFCQILSNFVKFCPILSNFVKFCIKSHKNKSNFVQFCPVHPIEIPFLMKKTCLSINF